MKGWLDNFGKADNANDSKVSMSEDFVGLGYNTKGRNYSPAWGGQFQQGGTIPVAQNGVSKYMKKKIKEKQDESIAAQYDLPEVVVQGFKDASPWEQAGRMPQYTPSPTVPFLEKTKDPAEFFKSWITSPEYRRRKIETDYPEYAEYSPVTGNEVDDPYKGPLIDRAMRDNFLKLEQIQRPGAITYDPTRRSEYFVEGEANVNPKDFAGDINTVKAHEIAHAVDTNIEDLSSKERELLTSATEGWLNKRVPKTLSPELYQKVQLAQHLEKPTELKADLNALRFLMYDEDIYDIRKGEKFTKEHLEKAKEKLKGNQSLDRTLMVTGDDNLINLMNIIAKKDEELTPIAMNGTSMPGSVGFTYARVAGAAPSKGKYAKKTMASAQNGIMSPMLLARNVLNYFYPSEEATSTVGAAPVEYKKGLTDELLKRQAYKESTFNPAAVSPAGYKGLTQIGEEVLTDYSKKKGGKKLDPFNPKDAVELQKFAMDDLYNASFINKPNQPDSVRIAKTLAAYNWGRGNLFNYLNEQKQKGVDIYDSYDWLNDLPKETSDYVNKILLQEDQSFNKNYKRDSTNPKYKDVTSLYDKKRFGGKVTTAQNGQEMRFYQNGLDWKPKSMQDGGKIYEGQELPEVVVEGKDERMREAMSQGMAKFYGHVGELMGAPQKEMMQLITGKEQTPSQAWGFQKPGGWLDSYSSFGKNAFNFGMDAIADPLNAVGVGLADDIFKLSVKNVGKNLTKNLGKGVGKRAISQAPSPRMMVDDVSAQLTNSSNQLGNTATQVPNSDPFRHQQRWQEKKDEILKHIETEEGRKRLQGIIDNSYFAKNNNLTVDEFIEKFKQTKFEAERPREIYLTDQNGDILRDSRGYPIKEFEKNPDGTLKMYPNSPIDAYHWPREGLDKPSFMYAGRELTPYDVNHTLEHEFGHFFQYGDLVGEIEKGIGSLADIKLKDNIGGGDNFRDVINKFNPFYKKTSDLGESETRKIFGFTNPSFGFDGAKRYWNIGSGGGREKYPFAAEIRENLLQSGILKNRYDEITPEMLKKHKRLYEKRADDRYYLRLYEIMEDTKDNFKILSNALNKMPAVALPAAGGAAALTSGLQDEQPVQKQKNGGITKDNLGYWNPNNWGKPVEIGSNNITMEGVYEPLLGISDTGDTKLMKPGKNYKFKGKKVTEFPVAELGINQLDAQPMKKLNQLLNFTNNPDKDNWLDKYN